MKSPLRIKGCVAVFLLAAHSVFAQRPVLKVEGTESQNVALQKLAVDVTINGTMALTSWTMTFKNSTSRRLEGELTFPLGDGINVSRYALDINGRLREAVPVEKAKGAVVFESIERRRVDPGLLEKLEGNSFRTRIYPFNPNDSRTVLIGYEEELSFDANGALRYKLPLGIKQELESFDLKVRVLQSHTAPVLEEDMNGALQLAKEEKQYTISKHFTNYAPDRQLSISLPKQMNSTEILMQERGNKYYYLVNTFVNTQEVERKLPHQFTIVWDASLSSKGRNLSKELALLDDYISLAGDAQINLVCFSNSIISTRQFLVTAGNSNALRSAIQKIEYDGATNLSALDFSKMPGEEVLLFSDGHNTFLSDDLHLGNKPVHCITSLARTDFPNLHYICRKTGGTLINLTAQSREDGLRMLRFQPLRFLGIRTKAGISDTYPSLPVAAGRGLSIAGISPAPSASITLLFGYGNKVAFEKTVLLDYDKQAAEALDISRIWAQKKINELNERFEENKEEISRLGRRYSIVTRNSSLIVLETVQDYIQYNIEPPAELREQYAAIMKQRGLIVDNAEKTALKEAEDWMKELVSWYAPPKPKPAPKPKPVPKPVVKTLPRPAAPARPSVPNGVGALAGTVYDEMKEPLSGAIMEVLENGVRKGAATTDIDGKYIIKPLRSSRDYELRVSYTGYLETRLTGVIVLPDRTTYQNFNMKVTGKELQEVVVKTYRIPLIKRDEPGTTTTITSEQIEKLPSRNTNDIATLSALTYQNKSGSEISIAGARAGGTSYIIDGLQVSDAEAVALNREEQTGNEMSESIDISFDEEIEEEDEEEAEDGASASAREADYIRLIRQAARDKQYPVYLSLREKYHFRPVFFYRVAGYFYKTGRPELGLRILSNLAELGIEDYELYKMLGYKLREEGEYKAALYCFRKVVKWRPSEPQSYRDYGLALEDAGDYQRAFDTLYTALVYEYPTELRNMYDGYQEVLLTELNQLVARHGSKIRLRDVPKQLLKPMPVDIRVVLNWNMNDTDVDLWVTDPEGEKCFYGHPRTAMGGKFTNDFTEGFGPEQFQVRKAKKGVYTVQVNYYGDRVQKIAGPTTLLAEIYTNYGTPKQERQLVTLQLNKTDEQEAYVAEFNF